MQSCAGGIETNPKQLKGLLTIGRIIGSLQERVYVFL
jgi:hypothetical protein